MNLRFFNTVIFNFQANYKIAAAKLHYEIYALTQRLRLTTIRVEYEEAVRLYKYIGITLEWKFKFDLKAMPSLSSIIHVAANQNIVDCNNSRIISTIIVSLKRQLCLWTLNIKNWEYISKN